MYDKNFKETCVYIIDCDLLSVNKSIMINAIFSTSFFCVTLSFPTTYSAYCDFVFKFKIPFAMFFVYLEYTTLNSAIGAYYYKFIRRKILLVSR